MNLGLSEAKTIVDISAKKEVTLFTDTNKDNLIQAKKQFDNIGATTRIDLADEGSSVPYNDVINFVDDSPVTCPRCHSTSITTGQRGFKITTGFLGSNKTVNRCAKCGYTWKPKL